MSKVSYMMRIFFLLLLGSITLNVYADLDSEFPQSKAQRDSEKYGSILGTNGLNLYDSSKAGKDKNSAEAAKTSENINPYLWQAALDSVQFMPLSSTDFNGGVINTDWYMENSSANQMYKVNILIKSSELNMTSLQVRVFKKQLQDGQWVNVKSNAKLASDLEDKILNRAREIRNTPALPN